MSFAAAYVRKFVVERRRIYISVYARQDWSNLLLRAQWTVMVAWFMGSGVTTVCGDKGVRRVRVQIECWIMNLYHFR